MWIIKRKPHQSHWSIIKSVPKKRRRVPKDIRAVTRTGRSRRGGVAKDNPCSRAIAKQCTPHPGIR